VFSYTILSIPLFSFYGLYYFEVTRHSCYSRPQRMSPSIPKIDWIPFHMLTT